jgi:xeroderma pigmentosum group C-complementing protein
MPTTIVGFKDHPLYALERHLKRGESVYPRANVLPLKSAENWMRAGRKVKEGCQPMKQVKQRAATVNKQREIELAMADGGEGVTQGLYALNQTEIYRPDPIVNVSVRASLSGPTDSVPLSGQDTKERLWKYRSICTFHASSWRCTFTL